MLLGADMATDPSFPGGQRIPPREDGPRWALEDADEMIARNTAFASAGEK